MEKKGNSKIVVGIVIAVVALVIVLLIAGNQTVSEVAATGKLSADGVDIIPDISIQQCLDEIKSVNPEISDQAANDNCYSIEAVNKDDKSLCQRVSEGFRENCLAQF